MAHPLPTQNLQDEPASWQIKKSNISGRGIFATQPIQRGTLIFRNRPLMVGPLGDHARKKFCSICYVIKDTCYSCEKCGIFVCSATCETSQQHTKECDFVVQNWKLKPGCEKQPTDLTRALVFIRSLLLDDEEMHLLSSFQKNQAVGAVDEVDALCANYDIPEEQIKLMKSVDSITKLNAFRIAHGEVESKVPLRGLYYLSGLLNHSCIPNTRNAFDKNNNMAVYATRDIEIGEEILTCYTGLLWCTPARRCQLQKTKKFWCKCERCSDPTEMGTRLSALKCLNKECVGVLLPTSPLDPACDWRCDNCSAAVAAAQISVVQSVLGSLVGTLDLDDQFRLETLVLERLSHFIPYSNHIFVDLRLRLGLKLGFTEKLKLQELTESRLALKESLCRGTLRTAAALGVGDAHLRGLLLYHLHAALAERARRSPELYEVPDLLILPLKDT
ncbi:SET domain-containing protein SmydA-8-like [Ostrinia nubilalis]|uniref:SET domain-containing protein SmydA-8-like n=1 Tax=Ostrinia nubilalis TaxID=29057 RepID=UPI0030824FBB